MRVHDNVGENVGLFSHHAIRNIVEMEQITEEIGNNPQSLRWARRIAVCCQCSSLNRDVSEITRWRKSKNMYLKTAQGILATGAQFGAPVNEPVGGISSDPVTIGMVGHWECAVADKVGEGDVYRGSLAANDGRVDRRDRFVGRHGSSNTCSSHEDRWGM